jgi:putative tryptophan/tyrosine transport system substrate-binding protein
VRRREFIALLGSGAVAWPLRAMAQQPSKIARIGYLGPQPDNPMIVASYSVIASELRRLGFVEGQNLTIAYRHHNVPGVDIPSLAAELVQTNVDTLVADGPEAILHAAVAATDTIAIAMIAVNFDPIARHYIASLARPGGNVTGVFFQSVELVQKQLDLLKQALPGKTQATALYDELSADQFKAAKQAAERLNLEFHGIKLENPPYDFDAAFRFLAQRLPDMLLVLSSAHFTKSAPHIARLAIQRHLPTMFTFKSYVEAGGFMSYGVDYVGMHRQIAPFLGKILNGANPADIPVEQPTKFEFVINLKTAKALGLDIPPGVLAIADEVIE